MPRFRTFSAALGEARVRRWCASPDVGSNTACRTPLDGSPVKVVLEYQKRDEP